MVHVSVFRIKGKMSIDSKELERCAVILQFGRYKLDVDVEKTKKFYETAERLSEGCSCDGCRNFEQAVDILPRPVTEFFAMLGIDPKRICECTAFSRKTNNALFYQGFCHACGTVLEGESAWKRRSDGGSVWDDKLTYPVSEDFHVSFRNNTVLLEESFPLPACEMAFTATVPWVLDKRNTY